MVTPNKALEQPARGTLVGVWDTPVNSNMDIIDASLGAVATIALTNSPVVLSSAQYRDLFITFTGTLSGNCAITFPSVGSKYTIQNLTANTSAFQVTLLTTAAGAQVIGAPWGEPFEIMTDLSGNVKFHNIGRVGTFMDWIGSSVPAWLVNCTIPPYLNCDGSAFSSATYPVLATILGGTTLPDSKGSLRATLNQGTARITAGSSTGGVDGNTNLSRGGSQVTTLSSLNMPPVPDTHVHHIFANQFISSAGNTPNSSQPVAVRGDNGGTAVGYTMVGSTFAVNDILDGVTSTAATNMGGFIGNTTPTNFSNLPPVYIAGLTFVRAG